MNIFSIAFDNLTTAQRNAIVLPAKGLVIFNSDEDKLQINEGTPAAPVWVDSDGTTALFFADYNDAATSTTPISLSANVWTDLTNDGAGPYSNTTYLPSSITQLLDTSTGYLDLSQLELGDSVIIRNDFIVTPNGNRANLNFRYSLGTGLGSYTLDYFVGRLDSGAGIPYRFNLYTHYIYLGDDNTRLNPIKLQLNLSKNGSVVNNGSAIQVLKR
jgi:hypothetical protein